MASADIPEGELAPLPELRSVPAFEALGSDGPLRRLVNSRRDSVYRAVATVLLVGLSATAIAAIKSVQQVHAESTQRFDRLNDRIVTEVSRRADLPIYGLHGARGVYASSKSVERNEFAAYVRSRDLPREFPGVLAMGFVQRVELANLDPFVAETRADDCPTFTPHPPAGETNATAGESGRWLVKYANPEGVDGADLGVDLAADPSRLIAAKRAVSTGLPTLTDRLAFNANGAPAVGFLYFVPVFRNGTHPATAAERLAALDGVLFASMQLDLVVGGLTAVTDGLLNFEVLESGMPAAGPSSHPAGDERWSAVVIGGSTWHIHSWATPKFVAGISYALPRSVGVSGVLLSVLLAALTGSLGLSRDRALRLARAMTEDLTAATERAESASRTLLSQSSLLQVQRERLDMALSGTGLGSWDWNPQTGDCLFDARWSSILGEGAVRPHIDEWIHRVHPEDMPTALRRIDEHFAGSTPLYECQVRMRHADGTWRWMLDRGVVVTRDEHNRPTRMVGTHQDITQRKNSEEQISSANAMLSRTGSMARVGGWEIDTATNRLAWTDEVYRIHELEIGTPISVEQAIEFYAPEARDAMRAALQAATRECRPWDLELPLITARGNRIWVRAQGECIREDGRIVKLCGAFQNITDRKLAEEALRQSATHDKLTGLPNRAHIHERIDLALRSPQRAAGRKIAVLFLDFDRFKLINDTLGHEAGDELLRGISTRLKSSIRGGNGQPSSRGNSMAGRLGGDEFVVILEDLSGDRDAIIVAERLLSVFEQPHALTATDVVSTASIGIVICEDLHTTADELLRDADMAMYEAKLAGKARYAVFDLSMRHRVQQRMRIESDLRKALDLKQLFLVYQPIVSLESGRLAGVEALIRWQRAEGDTVSPADFIPVAEETGLILPIGEWVLRAACGQFVRWRRDLGDLAPGKLNVNLSRKQLALQTLPKTVARILAETGMAADDLYLEVTESAVMKDPAAGSAMLRAIKGLGVHIALDDFGTGHSSLASLHQFPIDELKIDRSFIANMASGREFASLVHAVAQLARNLGIRVVAEGVETADQIALLQTLDCEFGQGYHFSKPLLPEAIPLFAANHRPPATLAA